MTLDDAAAVSTPRSNEPTRASERVEAIDIIRGFALFGILMVNLQLWFRTTSARYELEPHPWPGLINAIVDVGLPLFFEGKFVSVFSMLFGIGLAIQMERTEARGVRLGRFALRRLGALFLLGLAHIVLIWWGDILHIYAIVGALLLLFLRRKTKTIVVWAAILVALPMVIGSIMAIVGSVRSRAPAPMDRALLRETIDSMVRIYRDGGWLEIARFRLVDYIDHLPMLGTEIPFTFTGFLIGLVAWRTGIVKWPSEHLPILKKILVFSLLFGLSIGAMRGFLNSLSSEEMVWQRKVLGPFGPGSQLALGIAYASGLLLLLQKEWWRARLTLLAYAGRMALTNYIMQSIICSFIFYGFGLGLYDQLGPAAGILVVVLIYALQLVLSRWWFGRYEFGPVEWLWRSVTYGDVQAIRLRSS